MKKLQQLFGILILASVASCSTKLNTSIVSVKTTVKNESKSSPADGLPLNLSGYNATPTYVDDFNAINRSEWIYRNGYFSNFGAGSKPSLVTAHDDTLHIGYKRIADTLEGGGLISKHLFGYGYYSIKAKLYSATPGFHQSFFAQGLDYNNYYSTPKTDSLPYFGAVQEVDCFEVESESTTIVGQNFHTGYPVKSDVAKLSPGHNTAIWFTAGFEWVPGMIRYYINNVKVDSIAYLQTYCPANLWITALPRPKVIHRYPHGIPDPIPGAEMVVDYIKYYNKEMDNVNLVGNASFEYNNSFRGHNTDASFVTHPLGWIVSPDNKYTKGASTIINDTDNPGSNASSRWKLKLGTNGAYKTLTHQNLEFLPNGFYTLTAYVKASSNRPTAFFGAYPDIFLTAEQLSIADSSKADMTLNPNQWTPIVIPNIHVTNGNLSIGLYASGQAGQSIKIDSINLQNANNHQVLIDNTDSGFSTDDSSWAVMTNGKGYYGDTQAVISGSGHWAKWVPVIPSTGSYNVYVHIDGNFNQAQLGQIDIFANGNASKVNLNHQSKGRAWVYIGTYSMSAGSANYVRLNTVVGRNTADAVLFVKN